LTFSAVSAAAHPRRAKKARRRTRRTCLLTFFDNLPILRNFISRLERSIPSIDVFGRLGFFLGVGACFLELWLDDVKGTNEFLVDIEHCSPILEDVAIIRG
jgi:hypothetical protein